MPFDTEDEVVGEMQYMLQSLHTLIPKLREHAGEDLIMFRDIPEDLTQEYERDYELYWLIYSNGVHELKAHIEGTFGVGDAVELREFHRLYSYRKIGRAPPDTDFRTIGVCIDLGCPHTRDARLEVASRFVWLHRREQQGLEKYPPGRRYDVNGREADVLKRNMPKKYHWLVNWTTPLSWETGFLIRHIAESMYAQRYWRAGQEIIMEDAERQLTDPDVTEVTVPWTHLAIISENKTCVICNSTFGHEHDPGKSEPAVKCKCGHIFGADCLQQWINSKKNTCPTCRANIFEPEIRMPQVVRARYESGNWPLNRFAELDEAVDALVTLGPREIYPTSEYHRLNRALAVSTHLLNVCLSMLRVEELGQREE